MRLGLAIMGLGILSGATSLRAEDLQTESPDPGAAVRVYNNGFRLVEHGKWESRASVAPEAGSPIARPRSEMSRSGPPAGPRTNYRPEIYLPQVREAEFRYALPEGLLDALVWVESRYNPLAISKAGAGGLGQLMPGTARELGVRNRFDPRQNVDGAARYLRQMIDRFNLIHLALAAYNAGPRAVERSSGVPQNGETPAYVRNVL
ncbi:lytic transglycosylase domain-containing protein [Novosphingobium aquimarinum]|uniref:lytic transglycosylase domain-containing protein n=1 Tax=Novosphingobium aquimarinum TaxID=2682494 RepID=UPI001E395A99|nr:lytic transglycosylase domain-containing protein [Novosphingobium aquimarinum]